jgi:DNA-directed RNA polymerase subunit RPC12/RpoP
MKETKCPQCGAFLKFEPGTTALKCPYCSSEFPIQLEKTPVQELDYLETVAHLEDQADFQEISTVKCTGCSAQITFQAPVSAKECPYCASSLIDNERISKRALKPRYLLPFASKANETNDLFKQWIGSLWFAPNSLKSLARKDRGITGIYVPYWTFDADTITRYQGERCDVYYEPETHTTTRDGRTVTETVMVQKIRWTSAQGSVPLQFDDILVSGSNSLPSEYIQLLEPWDLENLISYDDGFLSGFLSETYQIGPQDGFETAKARMDPDIAATIQADIGGDVQQILSSDTRYRHVTLKHILLPVWISTYRYKTGLYRFLVNARTGEIHGERPWSRIKIALFALGAFLAAYAFSVIAANMS